MFLGTTEKDRLVSIRRDVFSERPHAMDNYQLQGTERSYESARAPGESDRVWFDACEEADSSGDHTGTALTAFEEELFPEAWRDPSAGVEDLGHGAATTSWSGTSSGVSPGTSRRRSGSTGRWT